MTRSSWLLDSGFDYFFSFLSTAVFPDGNRKEGVGVSFTEHVFFKVSKQINKGEKKLDLSDPINWKWAFFPSTSSEQMLSCSHKGNWFEELLDDGPNKRKREEFSQICRRLDVFGFDCLRLWPLEPSAFLRPARAGWPGVRLASRLFLSRLLSSLVKVIKERRAVHSGVVFVSVCLWTCVLLRMARWENAGGQIFEALLPVPPVWPPQLRSIGDL